MKTSVAEKFSDEPPTKPTIPITSREIARASRIDRLAELAIERLMVDPDGDSLIAAVESLVQIRSLTHEVLK
jgi:hypothetical protein